MNTLMKKRVIIHIFLLLTLPAFFLSCSKDEDPGPDVLLPKTDGFYIFGTNTIAEAPTDVDARMARAILDVSKAPNVENIAGVYGKFLYIGADSKIQFAEVTNGAGTVFGATGGGDVTVGTDIGNVPVNDMVIHGTLAKDAAAINVSEEGLYYAFVNANTGFFTLTKVNPNIIGDATPGNWGTGSFLPMTFTSTDSTVFEVTDLTLKGESGYRYRLADGWHFYQEENAITTLSSLGVASYGESWALPENEIGFFLENAPHQQTGIYTVRLVYHADTGEWEEKKIKTGEVLIDYSAFEMGIIGNAYTGGNFNGDGTALGLHTPVKNGNVYTWTWTNADLLAEGEFIFLEDGTWGGLQIDYTGATVGGTAVANGKIKDATAAGKEFHNFYVVTAGQYDITLVIDAESNTRTVTINE